MKKLIILAGFILAFFPTISGAQALSTSSGLQWTYDVPLADLVSSCAFQNTQAIGTLQYLEPNQNTTAAFQSTSGQELQLKITGANIEEIVVKVPEHMTSNNADSVNIPINGHRIQAIAQPSDNLTIQTNHADKTRALVILPNFPNTQEFTFDLALTGLFTIDADDVAELRGGERRTIAIEVACYEE